MTRYTPQGDGQNRLPHLLVPLIDTKMYSGVRWEVRCPYEGPRECGVIQECHGTDEDVAKWGCEPFPKQPPSATMAPDMSEEERKASDRAWTAFLDDMQEWKDVTHGGYGYHHTDVCWYAEVAIPNSDFEPEYFLADIPDGTPIEGPLKVLVGYEGSDEDTEPKFKLWEEPTDDPS